MKSLMPCCLKYMWNRDGPRVEDKRYEPLSVPLRQFYCLRFQQLVYQVVKGKGYAITGHEGRLGSDGYAHTQPRC
jgi:hypothetical protein